MPPLTIKTHYVKTAFQREGELFASMGLKGITDRSAVRRGSITARVALAAQLAREAEGQVMLWCGLNEESSQLARLLADDSSTEITGSMPIVDKEHRLLSFIDGATRLLVSKSSMTGFGLNLQNAHTAIFVGLNDSWELWFQAIRRLWRSSMNNSHGTFLMEIRLASGCESVPMARGSRLSERR